MPSFDPPPIVSPADLAQHATAADCWVAIHGLVYDISAWIPAHPGGSVPVSHCGRDASDVFERRPDGAAHSATARALLARMVVGVLGEGEVARRPLDRVDRLGRSRYVGVLPASHISPSRAVDLEVGHQIGAEANVWLGVSHGVKGWFDVNLGHATWTGETDLAFKLVRGEGWLAGGGSLGGGYRFQGVPDDHGAGVWAEGILALRPAGDWVEITLVPGVAWLPMASEIGVQAGLGLSFRPANLISLYVEGREDLLELGVPAWAAGLRFHTWAHSFTLGAASSPAIAPLERLAGPDGSFAVTLALSRQFGPSARR